MLIQENTFANAVYKMTAIGPDISVSTTEVSCMSLGWWSIFLYIVV